MELGLFDWRPRGVPLWERLRFRTHNHLLQELTEFDVAHDPPRENRPLRRLHREIIPQLRRNPFRSEPADLLVFGHPRRKLEPDGLWWDIYTDPLLEDIPWDYLSLEVPLRRGHLTPARTPNLRYIDPSVLADPWGVLKTGTPRRTSEQALLSAEEHAEADRFEDALSREFGVHVPFRQSAQTVLSTRELHLPVYDRLLQHLAPKAVLLLVSYGHGRENLIEAARALRIPTVELQHGTVSRAHLGYSFPPPRTKEHFPDYFLSFGSAWNDLCDWPIPQERVVSVGFPYLEQARERGADSAESQAGTVLFLSQGPFGKRLWRFALACAELHPELDIVYKIHPGERKRWRTHYEWVGTDLIRVVESDDPPLYELMKRADLVAGATTTALYEAAGLGKRVAMLSRFASAQHIADFRSVLREDALLIEQPEELGAAAMLGGRTTANDEGRIFREGATQNILSFLAPLVEDLRPHGRAKGPRLE